MRRQPGKRALKNQVMWYICREGDSLQGGPIHNDTLQCVAKTPSFLARSNEPCVDKTDTRRCELAHDRMVTGLDTYGECRDNRWAAKRHSDLSEWLIAYRTPCADVKAFVSCTLMW